MSDNANQRAAAAQERRRAFLAKVPEHFCPECTSVVYEHEARCFNCGHARPSRWPAVSGSGDRWLGQVLAERYLVTQRIALSSRARVYVADSRVIPRSFALKVMDVTGGPNLDEEGLRKRLRREVEALGTLRNPHIVSFYDVFDVGESHVGFVTDLMEGVTLTQLVQHGPLPVARALEITRQIANGLYEAHMRDLIHRDLKPNNVMVETLPSGDDFVRILDFGVMWVRGTTANTGAFDSVPVYTSPEQILDQEIDPRADLYSLGALLFFMLTGRAPFALADSSVDTLLEETAPLLEDVAGVEFPAQLEVLVGRLLSKDPAQRLANVSEVLEWLEEIPTDGLQTPTDAFEKTPSGTAYGVIPMLGDASSPVLSVQPSELSAVSEVAIDDAPSLVACRGGGYAYVLNGLLIWAGDFRGEAILDPTHDYISLAVCASRALLGTADGSIVIAEPDGTTRVAFQDPRRAPMSAVALVSSGKTMIAGSASGRLYVNRRDDFMRMGGSTEGIVALCLNDLGDHFGVARAGSIQVMAVGATSFSSFPLPLDETVLSMAFSPDAYLIAVLTDAGTAVLESVHTGQEFMRIATGDPNLRALTFSDSNHLMGLFFEENHVVLRALT